jgi:hypothetical protein
MSCEEVFLAPIFFFLYMTQNIRFFVKQLCKHLEHRDVRAAFFDILKCTIFFQKSGAYAPSCEKDLSLAIS